MSSKLLIDESPLVVQPSLAVLIGLNEAIFLQQVHYWLNPDFNKNFEEGKHWVHNTYSQWKEQFPFWGEKTIRRTISNLEERGILVSRMTTQSFKKTKFYTIDYEVLNFLQTEKTAENCGTHPSGQNDQTDLPKRADRCGQSDPIDLVNVTSSYKDTETTPEITLPLPQDRRLSEVNLKEDEEEKVGKGDLENKFSPSKPSFDSPRDRQQETSLPIQKALETWNRLIQPEESAVYLTSNREERLSYLLDKLFRGSLEGWKAYCEKIRTTQFLMGKGPNGWRVTLDWALDEENAVKVLEGHYYDPEKEVPPERISPPTSKEILKNLEAQKVSQEWRRIAEPLMSQIGVRAFVSWFMDLEDVTVSGSQLSLVTPSLFKRDQIEQKFKGEIEASVKEVFPEVSFVEIKVGQGGKG